MNYYWDGKCFFCIFWGTLIAIVSLSTHSIVKEHKKKKRYEHNAKGEDQYQIRQEQQNIKSMSKIKQTKIPMTLTGDNVLKIAVEQGVIENEFNWKLVRERDGLTNQSAEVMWLEFDEVGRFKDKYDTPAVGRSLIMSPFSQ